MNLASVQSPIKPKRLGRPPKTRERTDDELTLAWTETVAAFIWAVAHGEADEIACFGTRGDGKTMGVLGAMIEHSRKHLEAGFKWPVHWIGVTDTFSAHEQKTLQSLLDPMWTTPKGQHVWDIRDSGHLAVARTRGGEAVHLHLFGVENQSGIDRVRTQCHAAWFEEPAPAAQLEGSSGVNVIAWSIAITSCRLPSHCNPKVMTLNYPHEDHWTWQRFLPAEKGVAGYHPDSPSRMWFRIPPGERASPAQREAWFEALKDRPDLQRTLLEGKPGSVLLGRQVAEGFREDLHVARERLRPVRGEPLLLGQDFGLTPTTVIGQVVNGERRILAALACERGGIRQHLENSVIPWLQTHAPWALQTPTAMIRGCYDPSGETGEESDIERNAVATLEQKLGGLWYPGPVKWESRRHVLVSAMNHHARPGQVSLQVDPVDGRPLVRACSGQWYYPVDRGGHVQRDGPKKPNHPWEDLGDALIYWLWALTSEAGPPAPLKVESIFDTGFVGAGPRVVSEW
jgi:hypothetical protein